MNDISDRVKELRKTLDLSQEKFGKLAGVSKAAVSQWEAGLTKPERDALLALQRNKKVNPSWVTNNEGSMFLSIQENPAAYHVAPDIDLDCLAQSLEAIDYLEERYTRIKNNQKKAEILWELYKINKENMDKGEAPIDTSNVVRLAKLLA